MKLATTYLGFKLRTPLFRRHRRCRKSSTTLNGWGGRRRVGREPFQRRFEEQLRPGNIPMRRSSGNGGDFSRDALDDYSDEPDFKVIVGVR